MTIPVKDDVKQILLPYHGKIRRIVEDAWAEWRAVHALRIDADLPPVLYNRTISNYVFDAIARRAIPAFGGEDRVKVEVEAQTFKLFFNGLVARFKKGGEDRLGCNIPTQAALAFVEADGTLPGLPPETAKVEIIWLPNEIWTQLDSILVIARDGDRLLWEYEIEEAEEAGGVIVTLVPPPEPPEGGDGIIVKPKSKPAAESKE